MGKETVDAHKKKQRLYSGVRPAPFLRQQRGHKTNTIPLTAGTPELQAVPSDQAFGGFYHMFLKAADAF